MRSCCRRQSVCVCLHHCLHHCLQHCLHHWPPRWGSVIPDLQLCWPWHPCEGLAMVGPPSLPWIHSTEFIPDNPCPSVFGEQSLAFAIMLLETLSSQSSSYTFMDQISFIYVNSCLLINSGAELGLLSPTVSRIFSNNLVLGRIELGWLSWHQYLWDCVSPSINKRIPSRIVILLSALDSCACTHMRPCTHNRAHTHTHTHTHTHRKSRSLTGIWKKLWFK